MMRAIMGLTAAYVLILAVATFYTSGADSKIIDVAMSEALFATSNASAQSKDLSSS